MIKRRKFDLKKEIIGNQPWLNGKEIGLENLLEAMKNEESIELLKNLINNFQYLDDDSYKNARSDIAKYIVEKSGFNEKNTQIVATAYNSDADSSQAILQALKMPLYKNGWQHPKLVNTIGKCFKEIKKGKTNIVLVDEFLGSGKTIKNRLKYLLKSQDQPVKVKCCFIAAMKHGIQRVNKKYSVEIFTPLLLKRGISDNYCYLKAIKNRSLMKKLESELAEKVGEKKLIDYSLGYGKAEALYSGQEILGNSPNSVFPIFWWPFDKSNKRRKTILIRVEEGL